MSYVRNLREKASENGYFFLMGSDRERVKVIASFLRKKNKTKKNNLFCIESSGMTLMTTMAAAVSQQMFCMWF